MTRDTDWSEIKRLVADVLERPLADRAAFIIDATAGRAELRREVQSLVDAHDSAGTFIDRPADVPAEALSSLHAMAEGLLEGGRIGPYRVIRRIGTGGMGSVYLAERADEAYEKLVAIKVVAGALARPDLISRFLTERRILAALDHPHIARLLDAGTTETGLPYVVMEYVDGEPIDIHCRPLPLAARLRLFQQVCGAVQYAHQRLVIHRDLKAGNILVNAAGQPKLLDFGIAKLVEPDYTDTARTDTVGRAMTPESASPEQLRDEPVTLASDIFSLGVLLYRLITDRKPFDGTTASRADLARAICEVDPPPPSQAAAPGAHRISRELDWITMMALRKEPERRHASANELAEDIGRHLDGRPVLAAPDRWTYRARKLLRRRWPAVAAAAAVLVAVAAGATATYIEGRRAERRFNDVRKLANSVVGEIYDAIAELPGSTSARELLVSRALEYLDSLAAEATGDRALQRELADAYLKIGDVQGNPFGANLGDTAGAAATYRKLVQMREALFASGDRSWSDASALALAHSKVGDMAYGQAKYQDAMSSYERALAVVDGIPAPPDDAPRAARLKSRWDGRIGVALTTMGRSAEARVALERAIRQLRAQPSLDRDSRGELGIHLANLGDVAYYQKDFAAALEHHRQSVDIFKAAAAEDGGLTSQRRVMLGQGRVGADLVELGRLDEGILALEEGISVLERIMRGDPANVQFQFDLADMIGNLASTYQKQRKLDAAAEHVARALAMADDAYSKNPSFKAHRFNYAAMLSMQGGIEHARGRTGTAVAAYRRSVRVFDEPSVSDRDPAARVDALEGLGDSLAAENGPGGPAQEDARRFYQRALDEWRLIVMKRGTSGADDTRTAALETKLAAASGR